MGAASGAASASTIASTERCWPTGATRAAIEGARRSSGLTVTSTSGDTRSAATGAAAEAMTAGETPPPVT
jgi:hypothetical protein